MQKLFACLIKETRAVVILKCVNNKQKKKESTQVTIRSSKP